MAKPRNSGLTKWFKQDWVDIGSKKKGGGHKKCGRSKQNQTELDTSNKIKHFR